MQAINTRLDGLDFALYFCSRCVLFTQILESTLMVVQPFGMIYQSPIRTLYPRGMRSFVGRVHHLLLMDQLPVVVEQNADSGQGSDCRN